MNFLPPGVRYPLGTDRMRTEGNAMMLDRAPIEMSRVRARISAPTRAVNINAMCRVYRA